MKKHIIYAISLYCIQFTRIKPEKYYIFVRYYL